MSRERFTDAELEEMIAEPCTVHLYNFLHLADAMQELLIYRKAAAKFAEIASESELTSL